MKCPVCNEESQPIDTGGDGTGCDCPNCGKFFISGTAAAELSSKNDKTRTILSHTIWKGQQSKGRLFEVYSTHVESAIDGILPSPAEKVDLLILFVGDELRDTPGEKLNENARNLRAKLCAMLPTDVSYVSKASMAEGLLQENDANILRLTMKGWEHYELLKKGTTHSRAAFMAMPFGVDRIDTAFSECFSKAVDAAGFHLERVDTRPEAGSIDDRIRVQIRNAKFVIADLTNQNPGAYWEAGYAEGLGKKVIYTCEDAYFHANGTHFDTRQFFTVIWKPDDLSDASERLTAVIRNTFPTESKMPAD